MGLTYGASLLLDSAFFSGVGISTGLTGALAAELGVHTLLIGLYAVGSLTVVRK